MERDKLIKIVVAAVIGLAAIVILAMNFLGGPSRPKPAGDEQPIPPSERSGGGRATPGASGD